MNNEPDMTAEEKEAVEAVYRYAASLMSEGKNDHQIVTALTDQGLDKESAAVVTDALRKQFNQEMGGVNKKQGSRNMLYGMLWAVGGTIVTVATFSAASGGGTYIVTYGAIIGGVIQFIVGAVQYSK